MKFRHFVQAAVYIVNIGSVMPIKIVSITPSASPNPSSHVIYAVVCYH